QHRPCGGPAGPLQKPSSRESASRRIVASGRIVVPHIAHPLRPLTREKSNSKVSGETPSKISNSKAYLQTAKQLKPAAVANGAPTHGELGSSPRGPSAE